VPKGLQEMRFPSEFEPYLLTIQHNSKKPLNKWSPQSGGDGGRNWLRRPNYYNIAVILAPFSPYFVLDIDGEKGYKNLQSLQIAYRKLPRTFTVKSPSGRHYYFRYQQGIKRSIGWLAPSIDIICHGYTLLPGSVIDGKRYEVLEDAPIVSAPDWLIKLASNTSKQIDMPAKNKTAAQYDGEDYEFKVWRARRYVEKMAPAVQGQGGHTQLLCVCHALRKKFDLDIPDCRSILCEYNARCIPPWRLDVPRERYDFFRKLSEAEKWHG